jgi:hypothetical protein
LRHELSHNLADLADEYETPYPGFPACSRTNDCREPNVTLRSARADIKWLDWIPQATQVPTPEGARIAGVGLFEGARYLSSGMYRPVESACKMKNLGQPFCPVCSEGLVRAFWNLPNTHLIDDAAPPSNVQASACAATTFSVTTPTLTPSTLTFAWTLDGQPQMANTASFVVAPRMLAEGRHAVTVTVKDETTLVRSDPKGLLHEQREWTLTVTACGDASVPADSGGAGGSSVDAGRADAVRSDGSGGASGSGGSDVEGGRESGVDDASTLPDGPIDTGTRTEDAGRFSDANGGAGGAGAGRAGAAGSRRASGDSLEAGCSCRVTAGRDDARHASVWLALACSGFFARRRRPRAAR